MIPILLFKSPLYFIRIFTLTNDICNDCFSIRPHSEVLGVKDEDRCKGQNPNPTAIIRTEANSMTFPLAKLILPSQERSKAHIHAKHPRHTSCGQATPDKTPATGRRIVEDTVIMEFFILLNVDAVWAVWSQRLCPKPPSYYIPYAHICVYAARSLGKKGN